MNDTKYAFAVSSVRSMENELFLDEEINRLIDTPDLKSALSFLKDKGFYFSENENIFDTLNAKTQKTWKLLQEILPEKNELDFLVVKNDFQNLKASLKSVLTNGEKPSLVRPYITSPDEILRAVKEKKFENLPKYLEEYAKKSYEILVSSKDGRLMEFYLDKASLETMMHFAKNTQNELAKEICEFSVAFANIKIALRLSNGENNDIFYEYGFIPCESIDVESLKVACKKGKEAVYDCIENTSYNYVCNCKGNNALAEKITEEKILALSQKAVLVSFGAEPLISYYLKFEALMKNIRIILVSKRIQSENKTIRERIRGNYV